MNTLTQQLQGRFQLSEAGKLHNLLGVQVCQNEETIALSHGHYMDKVLKRFGMDSCKPHPIPLPQIIGCLIYVVTGTRLDIAFETMLLSKYASQNSKHMKLQKKYCSISKSSTHLSYTCVS